MKLLSVNKRIPRKNVNHGITCKISMSITVAKVMIKFEKQNNS